MRIHLPHILIFLTCIIWGTFRSEGQELELRNSLLFWREKVTDSGKYTIYYYNNGCKSVLSNSSFTPNPPIPTIALKKDGSIRQPSKTKLLSVHGNISYDFYYRSNFETNSTVNNDAVRQHTERVSLNVMFKEKYPFKVNFIARQSNSPYFKDYFDPNIQFDRSLFSRDLKQQLIAKLNRKMPTKPDFLAVEAALDEEKRKLESLKAKTGSSSSLQKIVEERERNYQNRLLGSSKGLDKSLSDSLSSSAGQHVSDLSIFNPLLSRQDSIKKALNQGRDSVTNIYLSEFKANVKKIDSLSRKVAFLQKKYDSLQLLARKGSVEVRDRVNKASSEKELRSIARENGFQFDSISWFQQKLASVKRFSLGKSLVDYTELTAQNISVTGINFEYNPSYYFAIAGGKIDYRFRDFYNKNSKTAPGQYLVLGRVGIGNIERKALILTFYQGKKNPSSITLSDSINNLITLTGYSLEGILKRDENTSISAEFAKSTKPAGLRSNDDKTSHELWQLKDNSNTGINFKAKTMIRETNTRLNAFYRKTGSRFQSFSLFSYNTDQTAWFVGIDQPIFKNKISVEGNLRQNNFSNPFVEKTYKTNTVFKTFVLNLRFPKYPIIRAGYYPGTQVYIIDKDRVRENAYYIINGSASYSYRVGSFLMNSLIVYNRYINKATDSGFTTYKGINYYGSQTLSLRRTRLQAGFAYNQQPQLKYITLESSFDYTVSSFLQFKAGLKYNRILDGKIYVAPSAMLTCSLKQFGELQFQYDKNFLPTYFHTLYPVESGRIGYYKSF